MTSMSYQTVLFDWDGCLARTLEVWLAAYRHTFAHYGAVPDDREVAKHLGDWYLQEQFGISDAEGFTKILIDEAERNLKEVDLYPSAKETLLQLKSDGRQLALVSSSSRHILVKGLEHNDLTDIFSVIISGDDVTNHKPHPEPLELALVALSGEKETTVMIGDSTKDIGAANNFGVDSILVYHPSHDVFYDRLHLEAQAPTYIVEDLPSLTGIIK